MPSTTNSGAKSAYSPGMVPSQRSREMYAASGARELSGSRERVKPISPHTSRSRALHAPHVPSRMRYVLRAPTMHASISPWRPSGSSHTSRHPPTSSALVRRGIRQQLVGGHERGELRALRNLLGALYNARVLTTQPSTGSPLARSHARTECRGRLGLRHSGAHRDFNVQLSRNRLVAESAIEEWSDLLLTPRQHESETIRCRMSGLCTQRLEQRCGDARRAQELPSGYLRIVFIKSASVPMFGT